MMTRIYDWITKEYLVMDEIQTVNDENNIGSLELNRFFSWFLRKIGMIIN